MLHEELDQPVARDLSAGSGESRWAMASRWWLVNAVTWLLVAVAAATATADTPRSAATENAGVHQPAVDALREHYEGIFEGTGCADGDGLCPSEPIERWEMAVWLVRVLDGEEPPPIRTPLFDDVADGVWWAAHTERLAGLGVTKGCASGPPRYCPDDHVTRAQMATFLVRAFDLPPGPPAGFADVAATSVHAPNIDALAEAGVTAGCAARPARYCPRKAVTRAQVATFLARATGIIETPAPQPPTYSGISAGGFHTCAVGAEGGVRCWGNDEDGQAGPPGGSYVTVSAGGFHSCAVEAGGGVRCWGFDEDGQASPPGGSYTAVSVGGFHSCALDSGRRVACWGFDEDGQAGPPSGAYTAVSAGRQHTCALDSGGGVDCWGDNDRGQASPPSGSYTAVSAGGFHTCAIATSGRIDCWGDNGWGQASPPPGSFTAVAAGWQHTCAIATGGRIDCWGEGSIGQSSPPAGSYTTISAGAFHNCALSTAGVATCWGNNENGQTNTPRR